VVAEQARMIEELRARVAELERQWGRNSRNSSQPPSADGPAAPAPRSTRRRNGRRPGKQPGAGGSALMQVGDRPRSSTTFPPPAVGAAPTWAVPPMPVWCAARSTTSRPSPGTWSSRHARHTRDDPALAPTTRRPPLDHQPPPARSASHPAPTTRPGCTPSHPEPHMGIPASARRTRWPRPPDRRLHHLENPHGRRSRPVTTTIQTLPDGVSAGPGSPGPGPRFVPPRHHRLDPAPRVLRRRTRHPPGPHPRGHISSDEKVDEVLAAWTRTDPAGLVDWRVAGER
jgi:hypothetical protein